MYKKISRQEAKKLGLGVLGTRWSDINKGADVNPDPRSRLVAKEANNGEDATAGKFFYLGQQNGLSLSGGSGATGTAFGDMNGYTLTFTGQEPLPASEVQAPLATSLVGISEG